ncbi:MAG: hypothetical protein M3O61_04620 [Gemmatimonadota bacterium]|nr:hypothetical protein [Gemmatimonadota bacterium]
MPGPTPEELTFIQLSFGNPPVNLERSRSDFKKWVLLNGFEDIHGAIRIALERLLVFAATKAEMTITPALDIDAFVRQLHPKVAAYHFPKLITEINALFEKPFKFQDHIESFNAARNCLEHANGVVTQRHCNSPESGAIIIHGRRFKMFFKDGDREVVAVLGKPGPENAALMLGAEEFQFAFAIGQSIELSLKQFVDILNTCVFIRADIELKLKEARPD